MEYQHVDPKSQDFWEEQRLKDNIAEVIMGQHMPEAEIIQNEADLESPAVVVLAGYNQSPKGTLHLVQLWLFRGRSNPNDERLVIEYGEKRFELLPEKTKSYQTNESMTHDELEEVGGWLHNTTWNREASRQLAIVRGQRLTGQAPGSSWFRQKWNGFNNKRS